MGEGRTGNRVLTERGTVLVERAERLPAEHTQVVRILHERVHLVCVRGLRGLRVLRGKERGEFALWGVSAPVRYSPPSARMGEEPAYLLGFGGVAVEVLQLDVARGV